MSGGLAALLDDVATMAKMAAASIDDVGLAAGRASAKAAGVVVDDTAVTPRYVHGFKPERELPMIRRIAVGSLRNKLVFILPVALLLSQFAPWALTPLLMLGGTYLCFEGAEKIWGSLAGHQEETEETAAVQGGDAEEKMVAGAIRTDFILSAEIMVISLNEVAEYEFWLRAAALVIVAIVITLLVYGVVGLIVKMDDIGLHLAGRPSPALQTFGRGLVKAMPLVMKVLSTVGIAAMLWVGGHIILVGVNELGWHPVYEFVHHAEEAVAHAVPGGLGGFLGWLVNTLASAVIGLVVGAIVVGVMHLIPHKKRDAHGAGRPAAEGDPGEASEGGGAR